METDAMKLRRHALPLLAFFALSGLSLWPAIRAPFTRVVGVAHLHVWEELWHFWWTRTALLTGRSPFVTDGLGFPRGMNVFYDMSSLSLPLASLPLQGLLGVVGAYNAMAFFSLTAAAFGAYLLCHRLCGARLPALAGGVVFGFSPFLQTELSNGMMENLFAFALLPYVVLALLRMNRTGLPRDGFVAGLMAAFATLSSWYFLVMAALLSLLFFLAAGREADAPGAARNGHDALRETDRAHRFRAYLVMALTVTVIIAWPLLILGRGPTLERGIPWQDCVRGPLTQKSCIDVLSLFSHGRAAGAASPEVAAGDETLELLPFGVYIGKVTLLLVALALLMPRAARPAPRAPGTPRASRDAPIPLFWIVGFFLVVLLMLGPYLNINGRVIWGGLRIPLLNRLLLVVPGTGRVLALHNYRFASCVMLFAAVLASCSLARLLAGISRRLRVGFVLAVTWLILVDAGHSRARDHFLFLPVSDATLPPVFAAIADEPDGAIFNIPSSSGAHARPDIRGLQMFHQLAHGRPIPCDPIYEIEPPEDESALAGAARAMALRTAWDLDEQVLARDLEQLAARGFRLVAIYRSFLAADDEARIRGRIRRRLGPPLASDGAIELYRLAPNR